MPTYIASCDALDSFYDDCVQVKIHGQLNSLIDTGIITQQAVFQTGLAGDPYSHVALARQRHPSCLSATLAATVEATPGYGAKRKSLKFLERLPQATSRTGLGRSLGSGELSG